MDRVEARNIATRYQGPKHEPSRGKEYCNTISRLKTRTKSRQEILQQVEARNMWSSRLHSRPGSTALRTLQPAPKCLSAVYAPQNDAILPSVHMISAVRFVANLAYNCAMLLDVHRAISWICGSDTPAASKAVTPPFYSLDLPHLRSHLLGG
jgi:hypothetical protein